jgi:hypothetical protein
MSKYTLSQVIDALRTHHGLLALAADELGCSRQTLYNYAERYPLVATVLADERERLVDVAESGLYYHLLERAPWAIAFVLKSLGRGRGYGESDTRPASQGFSDRLESYPEWHELLATLHASLEAYPEAKWAVVRALNGAVHESPNGHPPGA